MGIANSSNRRSPATVGAVLVLPLVLFAAVCSAQTQNVTTTIEVTLDLFDIDTALLDEPYATALRSETSAVLRLTYPPFGWAEVHEDPLQQWATYWTFRPAAMTYDFVVGPSRWQGTSAGSGDLTPSSLSRVTFGSFASADGSVAFRVTVVDDQLGFELRAEELPRDVTMFNLPFLPSQPFPGFAEDLTASYARRLVVEIHGLGSVSVVFTGPAFSHGEPVLGATVEPSRGVSVESSTWGAVKALYD